MKIALEQILTGESVADNLALILEGITRAADDQADLVVFPEAAMRAFECGRLDVIAETFDDDFATTIHKAAEEAGVIAVVGMFEPADQVEVKGKTINRVYNTALIAGPGVKDGYRKIHRYDAFGFSESDTVAKGEELVTFPVGDAVVGVAICYDLRFPEQFVAYGANEADVIVVPTSFNDGDNKLEQFTLLGRARALDSTCFVAIADQARPGGALAAGADDGPTGLGHSMVVDPSGNLIDMLDYEVGRLVVDIDPAKVEKARKTLPIADQSRNIDFPHRYIDIPQS